MTKNTTGRIELALNDLRANASREFNSELRHPKALAQNNPFEDASSVVLTGPEVGEIGRIADRSLRQYVNDAVSKALEISSGPETFRIVEEAAVTYHAELEGAVERHVGLGLIPGSLETVAHKFNGMRSQLGRQLDSHRPSFEQPKNKGGRREMPEWEFAEAHVMASLEGKDLPPGAEGIRMVVEAMRKWFVMRGLTEPDEKTFRSHAKKFIKEYESY